MIAECPVCGSADRVSVVRLDALPVLINAQVSPIEAPSVPRGDIELVACCRCAHLYNASFDEARLGYDAAYENTLHYSPSFQAFAPNVLVSTSWAPASM